MSFDCLCLPEDGQTIVKLAIKSALWREEIIECRKRWRRCMCMPLQQVRADLLALSRANLVDDDSVTLRSKAKQIAKAREGY